MTSRRPWTLPKGARIAVWTVVNIEEWNIEKPMARQYLTAPQGVATAPDVPNWAWHDYGMRVGFWRLHEALVKRKIRATTSINARVVESYEPVARAMLDAGWEFMAHGVIQGAMHLLPDQRAAIRQSVEMLKTYTGKKPKGWLGPGLTETWETLDYLAHEGIEYVSEWLQRAKDQFDRLYAEGAKNPRVMALAVHPYISGVPHRIKYFEAVYDYMRKKKGVWFTTGEDIYEWYKSQR